MDRTAQRRLLAVLVALTLALLVADLAGSGVASSVRRSGGAVFGPVQRALSGADPDELARLATENTLLRQTDADQRRELADLASLRELLGSGAGRQHSLVAARVVATSLSPLGGRSLTLDAGSRDGIAVDSAVVASEGLVGRVVSVSPWTCDVQVLGSTGSVVGVRVGPSGALATVGPPSSSDREARPRGSLTLTLVQPSAPVVGDEVRTLGSVNETPYAAGLVVGTVTAVDPDRGQVTRTATVRPAIDPDAIDVVGVLVPRVRAVPRPAVSPSTGPSASATTPAAGSVTVTALPGSVP